MSDTSYTIIIILLVIVIAYMILTIPARIARDKGYSFLGVGSSYSEIPNN